ncbi:natural product biosynthesis luciferase-like monooxygenase protein [Nonlabens dokdonensis]|uniref:MelG protein n=2 Tax=Nonlabens dokdonensis TaxID=328515 RepID=L7W1F2_NONDD|nr:MupA/Atu3671 family FMN-dependent luciferase-like monooxygenase [Nonlabens dokdonensis]AGC75290.1 MelG protein [Nonlabens dokdonensis DSW-6]PZX36300.1 natural product biosynthesis luciferase-like monooxygenase protein [Nonlabens dokdonensis]
MKVAQLIKDLRIKGIGITLSDDNIELTYYKEEIEDSLIELIKENKQDIIEYLKSFSFSKDKNSIPLTKKKEFYFITSLQMQFWILCQFENINRAYNLPLILKMKGFLDLMILRKSVNELVKRHEILRTHFAVDKNSIVKQRVLDELDYEIKTHDIKQKERINEVIIEFINEPFLLEESNLFKIFVINMTNEEHYLCINMHHIISDGSSLETMLFDLSRIYNSLNSNSQIDLPELRIQFKDYSEWINDEINIKNEKEYWLEKYSDEIPIINLPTYKLRPSIKTYNGANHTHVLSKKSLDKIRKFSIDNGGTIFVSLMAAINGLLYRYTSQTDIILGIPISGRNSTELRNQIGLYINTLPIRMRFSQDDSFFMLFNKQKRTLNEAYANANFSFADIINELNLERNLSRSPLFDILVTHQQQNEKFNLESGFDGLKCTLHNFENTSTKYDLTFSFFEEKNRLSLSVAYNTDLFEKRFIKSLADNFENFILQSICNPELEIKKISFLDDIQIDTVINIFNTTDFHYNNNENIISIFQNQSSKSSEKVALICEGNEMTYDELNKKSKALAYYLIEQGVLPNTTVCICMGRSLEMVVAILGVLKSGASYLPIDPFYPLNRIDYIIEDSATKIVLVDKETKEIIPKNIHTVVVEESRFNQLENVLLPKIESLSLAYVIYTSGSTGKPKGVKVSHQNLMNFMIGMNQNFANKNEQGVWLAMTSISFDISILELLWTLTRGEKVIIHLERPITVKTKPLVDFSLFYFPTGMNTGPNKYKLLLEGAKFADKNAFKAIWVPERHFHTFGDQFPNPSVAAAAVSTITKNIKLRSGSVVLPLHDPVRVAEEWSMIDNLSEGRVELSIASGWHPNDFVLAPDDYENRHELMRNKITTLKSLWVGESLTRKNGIGKDFEFTIHPKPIQENLPIWITAAGNIETFKYAGSIGANILTHLLGQSIEELGEKIKIYRKTLEENGFNQEKGKVALMMHTFVSDDVKKVKNIVNEPFKNYLKNSLNLLKPIAEELGLNLNNDLDTLLDIGFLRYYKTSSLFGTPESCLNIINKVFEVDIDEIACLIDFGVEEEIVLENLEHLTKLKEIIKRSRFQYDFIVQRMEKLTQYEETSYLINQFDVTHIQSTPSFYEEFLLEENGRRAIQKINTLLVGGEPLKKSLAEALISESGNKIYNMYGPTETTIWSSVKEIKINDKITIGKPIVNTKIYILDVYNNLCPVGVSGELCIAGDGVSLGYLNRDDLTKLKFIDSPFKNNEKIYKTGDLACWLPDGELEHQGRIDNQVKIKGYRIELKEIENVIFNHEAVSGCVVLSCERNKELILTAYIKLLYDIGEDVIKEFLILRLPNYMIPNSLVIINEFPKTPNGKIDLKKLQALSNKEIRKKEFAAPRDEMEGQLTEIWGNFLKVSQIDINDNFFEIGGNSIKVFQILPIINSKLKTDLQILSFFQYPTIRQMAKYLKKETDLNKVYVEELDEGESLDDMIDFMQEL